MNKINTNITQASTLSSDFYQDDIIWNKIKESVFCKNWLYLTDIVQTFKGLHNVQPLWLLENYLDEPFLLTMVDDQVHCLSNVCTHRGFLLKQSAGSYKNLTCQYHGRRFDLRGQFQHMPEFGQAEDFPRPCDHLSKVPFARWRQFGFAAINPSIDFSKIRNQLEERLYFLPLEDFRFAPEYSKTYNVHAHWALYCDNYLEGFHIPFVHQTLGAILDYGKYDTVVSDGMVLQIGYSDGSSFTFDLPPDHPDAGQGVTAYYYWIYPNFMLNFYPWGVQLNIVKPITKDFTKVEFIYYIHDDKIFDIMQGDKLAEKTEREDEFVVEAVQRGIRSRFYSNGRFSPRREKGVHYFHRLLSEQVDS